MQITAFITAFKNTKTLARCIQALKKQTVPLTQILTVEDGHDKEDESLDIAREQGITVLLDHGGVNKGLPASSNTALKHAQCELFLKVDGDVELSPFWCEQAVKHFKDGDIDGVCGKMLELHVCSIQGQWRQAFMKQEWGPGELHAPPYLFGSASMFRTKIIQDLGGWNEKYRFNFQDVDLSQRLKSPSRLYDPACLSRHLLQSTLWEVMENSWRWRKHPDDKDYGTFEQCASKIEMNLMMGWKNCQQALSFGMPHLSYPCILQGYWSCMEDLNHMVRLGTATKDEAEATMGALFDKVLIKWIDLNLPWVVRKRFTQDMTMWLKDVVPGTANTAYLDKYIERVDPIEKSPAWMIETSVIAMEAGDKELAPWRGKA